MLNVRARGSTVGLTTELEEYFFRQIEAHRKADGKPCPGEEVCEITGPLRDKSRPAEDVCARCAKLPTKPGNIPGHLTALIVEALRLDRIREAGATIIYPDALSPIEWAALDALTIARRRNQEKDSESKREEQRAQEQRQGAAQMVLEAARRTGIR